MIDISKKGYTRISRDLPWGLNRRQGHSLLCSDGVIRGARLSPTADTWFSTPAQITIDGRTITGYMCVEEEVWTEGDTKERVYNNAYCFRQHTTQKNPHNLPAWPIPSDDPIAWNKLIDRAYSVDALIINAKHNKYQVIVGNVGTVYDAYSLKEASKTFSEYKHQSKTHYGRASGEQVTMFCNGEPVKQYDGEFNKPKLRELCSLITTIKGTIHERNGYTTLTIGVDRTGWNYQTGDSSYHGSAYRYPNWAVVEVGRKCNAMNVAREILNQINEMEHNVVFSVE